MADLNMPLSANFILKELVHSDTAERNLALKAEQENPPQGVIDNLKHLTRTALQPIRETFSFPILINSGYRSPSVNDLVGGSATSQHCKGQAADCRISRTFLTRPETEGLRADINARVRELTGKPLRPDVSENFYLFAYICLNLDRLDVDQVIHEYGNDFGDPAWVHIAASAEKDKRQILLIGSYTNRKYISADVRQALAYAT